MTRSRTQEGYSLIGAQGPACQLGTLHLGDALAADGFILYKNPQIEIINYKSRFLYGPNGQFNTRSGTNTWKDLSGRGNDFTIQGNITWNKDTGFSNFTGNSLGTGNKIYRNNFRKI